MEILKKNLNFKSSFQFPCSYLSGKNEKRLYVNLEDSEDKDILISELTQKGFRRNFDHMYFPICEHCKLCIPTRISIGIIKDWPPLSLVREWLVFPPISLDALLEKEVSTRPLGP